MFEHSRIYRNFVSDSFFIGIHVIKNNLKYVGYFKYGPYFYFLFTIIIYYESKIFDKDLSKDSGDFAKVFSLLNCIPHFFISKFLFCYSRKASRGIKNRWFNSGVPPTWQREVSLSRVELADWLSHKAPFNPNYSTCEPRKHFGLLLILKTFLNCSKFKFFLF